MKRSDLTIVSSLALLGLAAAFWFLLLAPKRQEASDLGAEVETLQASVAEQEQLADVAEAAEADYDENYKRLVALGKAVPEDSDTSSLLVEIQGISDRAKVSFDSIALVDGEGSAAASQVAPPAPLTPPSDPSGEAAPPAESGGEAEPPPAGDASSGATPTAATAPVAATEAVAATLPIGATVGPASLPVMPYSMAFAGGFFEVADFLAGLDGLVRSKDTVTGVNGRLLTVDGFALTPDDDSSGSDPVLDATLAVTTYLTPAEQGVAGGATPSAPPATTPVPTSSTTPAPAP